jgi:membrane protein implicated in regulation of membrane protease activity
MIATDPLSLVLIACFLVGLIYFIVTALLGNLGHGAAHATHAVGQHVDAHIGHHTGVHAHTGGPAQAHTSGKGDTSGHNQSLASFLNPTSVMFFLLGFGFFGYVFHNIVGLEAPLLVLLFAGLSGVVIALLLLYMITRLFGNSESTTEQDVSDRTGLLGKVSTTIQEGGMGEILYVSPGGMRKSIPARSTDGQRLERNQEVVVVSYQNGVAEVDTWERFINEEGTYAGASGPSMMTSGDLETLRTLLDESDKTDSQALVMRKDSQKE